MSDYVPAKTGLVGGSSLTIEDLDLSGLGLYLEKDPNVPEEDYFLTPYLSLGRPLYARKSDEGKKWRIYNDTGIVLQRRQ